MESNAHDGNQESKESQATGRPAENRRRPDAGVQTLHRRAEGRPADALRVPELESRISPDTSRDIGDILDRLGLRVKGVLTQAAHVLYGTAFLSDAPQCLLKMGRFRGTEITGRIVDNRQEHLHAFAMVREGMAFLERTMPLGARFPKGTVFREDRFPVPLEALREILLNAVMHRDYSYYGGHVAIVVFDDRIEIRSYGRLPSGVTVEQLSGPHLSELRNPLIAEAFHRTGAVEVWGRGTNRVIESCKKHGAPPPIFEERQGFVIVTFKARLVAEGAAGASKAGSKHQVGTKSALSRHQVAILESCRAERTLMQLMQVVGRSDRTKFRDGLVTPLLESGFLERTIPDKPRSRLQRYRTTAAGLAILQAQGRKP